jgi:cytochrome P450
MRTLRCRAMAAPTPHADSLPKATFRETLTILLLAIGPLVAKGIIVRRPKIVALLANTGGEEPGIRLLERLRRKYGGAPLRLKLPLRRQVVILSAGDLARVLAETPEPFASDSREKHSALAHFQPEGVLISTGEARAERRRFNERVLESACPIHSLGGSFAAIVRGEAERFLNEAGRRGAVDWPGFRGAWFRVVREVVFGASARGDVGLTSMLERLRADANWAFLKPRRRRLRERFLAAVAKQLDRAEQGSLASLMPAAATPASAPADQVAQWLFAFDAAGIAAYRTLALLAVHHSASRQVRDEADPERPYLRACILDCIRLWPTTPALLRETVAETVWDAGRLEEETGVIIHVPFFHRDRGRIPNADRFAPEAWLTGDAQTWPFVPFSAGPAQCPARQLVLFLAGEWIAALISGPALTLPEGTKLDADRLPATFDHFSLRLNICRA